MAIFILLEHTISVMNRGAGAPAGAPVGEEGAKLGQLVWELCPQILWLTLAQKREFRGKVCQKQPPYIYINEFTYFSIYLTLTL